MKIYILLNKEKISKKTKVLINEDSLNMKVVEFSNEDYKCLNDLRYFGCINNKLRSLVKVYKYENISYKNLDEIIKITTDFKKKDTSIQFAKLADKLIDCYKLAIELETLIIVYCEKADFDNVLHNLTED